MTHSNCFGEPRGTTHHNLVRKLFILFHHLFIYFFQIGVSVKESVMEEINKVKQLLKEEFTKAGEEWDGAENHIWNFGPRHCGPNILLNRVKSYNRPSVWKRVEQGNFDFKISDLDNSIINGFQIASLAGPLCEEPLHGVCFIVEDWWFTGLKAKAIANTNSNTNSSKSESNDVKNGTNDNIDSLANNCDSDSLSKDVKSLHISQNCSKSSKSSDSSDPEKISPLNFDKSYHQIGVYGPLSGQLISTMKEGCRRAFQAQPQRLCVAMYKCEVQATVEVLGMYWSLNHWCLLYLFITS